MDPSRLLRLAAGTLAVALAAVLVFADAAPAAPPPADPPADATARDPDDRPAGRFAAALPVRRALDAVDLDPEQRTRVREIFADFEGRLRTLMAETRDADPAERRGRLVELSGDLVDDLTDVLDADQQQAFLRALDDARRDVNARTQDAPGRRANPRVDPRAGREGDAPETRDAPREAPRDAQAGPRVGRVFDVMRQAVGSLDLSDEQREEVDQIFADARDDLADVFADAAGDRERLAGLVREELDHVRQKLQAVLSPAQQLRLRDELQRLNRETRDPAERPAERQDRRRPRADPPAEPPADPSADPGNAMAGMTGAASGDEGRAARPSAAPRSRFLDRLQAAHEPDLPGLLPVGAPLPRDLDVVTANYRTRALADHLDGRRPLVVVMGSASTPAFRRRLADLPWLASTLGRDAQLLVVYTRELHPVAAPRDDEVWDVDRNLIADVRLHAHRFLEERVDVMTAVRRHLRVRPEIVADTMDDAVLKTLAGDRAGVPAVVLAPDGTLFARQQWFDPTGIPELVRLAAEDSRR